MKRITLNQYNRAKEICEQYESQIYKETDPKFIWNFDLSVRTMNGLKSVGFETIGDVRKHYEKHGGNSFYRIRHIGRKSVEEIRLLLNIPYEVFHKSRWEVK